jgi:uncharacterized DUF497 family protein
MRSLRIAKLGRSQAALYGNKGIPCLPLCYMYNVHITELRFEWDVKKAKANVKRHGVSFEEARTVFYDENAFQFYDPDHSEEGDRFILLGLSSCFKIPQLARYGVINRLEMLIYSCVNCALSPTKTYCKRDAPPAIGPS